MSPGFSDPPSPPSLSRSSERGCRASLGARLVRGRVGPRWYVVAVTPYLMALALAGLVTLSGSPWPQLPAWSRIEGLPELGLLETGLVLLVVNGFGEEVGWRGYAVDRLITGHGTVATGLFVAGPWAVWHLPTFFLPTGLASMSPALAVGWLVGLVAGSVVLTWLYVSSGRSIWIVSLFHTALNLGSAVPAAEGVVAAGVSTAVMIGAVLIAFAERRRR